MFKKIKNWLEEYWLIIGFILLVIISLTCIGVSIYCFITYGNKPIAEVPSWALPFMFHR